MAGRGRKKLGKKAHQPGRVSVMWLPGWPCAGLRQRAGRCLSGCRVRGCFALHNVFLLPSIFIPRACRPRAQHIRGDAIFRQSDLAQAEISQHPPLVVGAGDHGISSLTHPPLAPCLCISPGLFCSTRESITLAAPAILSCERAGRPHLLSPPSHPHIVCATAEKTVVLYKGLCHRQIFFSPRALRCALALSPLYSGRRAKKNGGINVVLCEIHLLADSTDKIRERRQWIMRLTSLVRAGWLGTPDVSVCFSPDAAAQMHFLHNGNLRSISVNKL
jgi:hypothetical protein